MGAWNSRPGWLSCLHFFILPPTPQPQRNKTKIIIKNNQVKQKIKLSIEWWSSWPQREKGIYSLTLRLPVFSILPQMEGTTNGHEDFASKFQPVAQKGWGLNAVRERKERNSFLGECLGEGWRARHGLGQRELLCTRNPWEALIFSPNRSFLGFREDSYPENLKWGRGKPS